MTADAPSLIGTSPGLDAVRRAVARVAATDATVLVLGETGTGKELVARAVHDQGPRRGRAFVPITVPPLRDRRSDIPDLVNHFVRVFADRHGRSVSRVHPAAVRALAAHDWPGNVRELQNLVERAVIVSDGDELAFDPGWLV